MAAVGLIKTSTVAMMENRSVDHLLGCLSLPPFKGADVDGLSNDPGWLQRVTNFDNPIIKALAASALDGYLAGRPPALPGATVPAPDTNLKKGFPQAVTNLRQGGADSTHPQFGRLWGELGKLLPR